MSGNLVAQVSFPLSIAIFLLLKSSQVVRLCLLVRIKSTATTGAGLESYCHHSFGYPLLWPKAMVYNVYAMLSVSFIQAAMKWF